MYNYVINKHINKNCVSYFMDRLVSKHSNLHNFVIICTAKFRPYFVQKWCTLYGHYLNTTF